MFHPCCLSVEKEKSRKYFHAGINFRFEAGRKGGRGAGGEGRESKEDTEARFAGFDGIN